MYLPPLWSLTFEGACPGLAAQYPRCDFGPNRGREWLSSSSAKCYGIDPDVLEHGPGNYNRAFEDSGNQFFGAQVVAFAQFPAP